MLSRRTGPIIAPAELFEARRSLLTLARVLTAGRRLKTSMFGSFPEWTIAVWALIFALLVGTWVHRPVTVGLDRHHAGGCQHALINLC
jgi:hypothetical protein